ncbi:MAG: ThiF family adenylyltransferase [Solirubrobacteraceae bacterium]
MTRSQFIPAWAAANGQNPWQLVIRDEAWQTLTRHLFPGDHDEHGAIAVAGIVTTTRGTRLLVRELFLAEDGSDFVPAKNAHRRLTAEFVNKHIRYCRDHQLAYLAIHNHGGTRSVAFSEIDLRSHERGYPALLDIARGQPVGALVIAHEALAGDIWTPDGVRRPIGETIILGRNLRRIHPRPAAAPPARAAIDDRQTRIYGDAGQAILGRLKVGVIGAGGIGLPIATALARLGVGHIVVIDPERVEPTNLPRLPEATRRDAGLPFSGPGAPAWIRRIGARLARPKVRLVDRASRRARRTTTVEAIHGDIREERNARRLTDCDYLFLAADSHVARAVFNALVHQYLIPGVQVGSKVEAQPDGTIAGIYSVVRPVTPDRGCLWCNQLISPARLNDELLPEAIREAQRYLPADDAPAPSIGTLNAIGVAQATNHFMLAATALLADVETAGDYRRLEARTERTITTIPRRDSACPDCGTHPDSTLARGESRRLPTLGDP